MTSYVYWRIEVIKYDLTQFLFMLLSNVISWVIAIIVVGYALLAMINLMKR